MAWSDAARKAALEARRRNKKRFGPEKERMRRLHEERQMNVVRGGTYFGKTVPRAPSVKSLVRKSADITKHPRSQVSARRSLLRAGRDPETGRKVGRRAAKRKFDYLADMSND